MTHTLADFPGSWLGRRIAYGHQGHVGRLDGIWHTRAGFQLVITDHTGTHTTEPLPADTPIRPDVTKEET